ncbi:family decarboxylase protein [Rutstroemia sp. NJR-2017a BBW]|nr:family decarboxylase protein [Rutstroemia sp. NJR-2017a BBW]
MPLTVLKDSDIQELLHDLKLADLENFQKKMREALHEYSTGTQDDDCCSIHQPKRTFLETKRKTTTLFMPSTSSAGIGMKDSSNTSSDFDTASTSSSNSNLSTPQGSLTLMDQTGQPFGFLNATETTAFRTALASSLLITPRTKVKTLTVYGAGKQAFWHVRLALILRGHTIKTINVINRSFTDRTRAFLKSFLHIPDHVKEREGWASAKFTILSPAYGEFARLEKDYLRASDIIFLTTPSTTPVFNHQILTNTEGRKKGRLIVAIGSYKPHMIEIPLEVMAQAVKVHGSGHHFHKHAQEGGVIVVDTIDGCKEEAGEIIQSNISAKNLVELGELVMLSHGSDSSSAIDDTDDSPPDGASTPTPGSPLLSRSIANVFRDEHTGSTSPSSSRSPSQSKSRSGSMNSSNPSIATGMLGRDILGEKDDDMSRWLRNGNVIYKSVGMGLMDLVVGTELVRLAREKGVGVNVEGF